MIYPRRIEWRFALQAEFTALWCRLPRGKARDSREFMTVNAPSAQHRYRY
jgi:hypothetical protein